jgi:hypothetical protein
MKWHQGWWQGQQQQTNWDWSADSWSGMGSQSDWRGPKPARNSLTRKTTEEGKSYQRYTYLGGDSKASLPASERAKMVVHLFQDQITMVRAQQWSSDTLDAVIFMATRAQPTTKLHCLSIDPIQLREMLSREFSGRKTRHCDNPHPRLIKPPRLINQEISSKIIFLRKLF